MSLYGSLSKEEWEALCDGCGLCCALAPDKEYACKGLDCATNKCKVYNQKNKPYPCLPTTLASVPTLHAHGILPDSCGYVRHAKGEPPLSDPPVAVLKPLASAPLSVRRRFAKNEKIWLRVTEASSKQK